MSLILNGRDNNSKLTLCSPLKILGKTLDKLTGQGMININRSSSSNSIQSAMTVDSRFTLMEE